ncbi:MAG: TetR/AcrR family transcriptional regulator [Bacteroidales bacterium]|nr:TetR/AcrR family transcriptional regulator [Bacteroidales bacterium]
MVTTSSKEIILETARNIFRRFGFAKTSIGDIAIAARKGRRTIYTYFENKEDIYKAVIEKEVNVLKISLVDVILSESSTKEKLKDYFITRMMTINVLANYYEALRNDYLQDFKIIEKIREDFDNQEISMISEILTEGVENNEFKIENINLTAKAIVIALKGFEIPFFIEKVDTDFESQLGSLIDILFNGILKR